ncbi:MauE/DoxX family redox-associated membrane protein [Catellatospora methionotrophica]|uniref:MauE/DoxX family redox-associated membrane protein n=1 Tax=Catellatospora methionotrophica TaxID=121620 RepID=UPI003403A5B8
MSYVEVAGRLLLVTVFGIALAGKVSSRSAWAAFEASLRDMDVVPVARLSAAARASAAAELAVIACLLIPGKIAGFAGFILAAGLLAVFTVAIALVVRRKRAVPCRCFGASAIPLSGRHLARNGALIAVALAGAVAVPATTGLPIPAAVLAGVVGAVAGMLVAAMDDLVALVRP